MADPTSGTFSWSSWWASDEEKEEVQEILHSLPLGHILAGCSNLRNNINCTIDPDLWARGSQNLVLELVFDDGVRWVLKTTYPPPGSEVTSAQEDHRLESAMENLSMAHDINPYKYEPVMRYKRERDAMNFLRHYTDLPVPKPHGLFFFQANASHKACACLAMDFVAGTSGKHFFIERVQGITPEREEVIHQAQERILKSLARIQITLAKFQSTTIGYLGRRGEGSEGGTPVNDEYEVEENGSSSHQSPEDCYKSLFAERKAKFDGKDHEGSGVDKTARRMLDIMGSTIQYVCEEGRRSYLTLFDNGGHNIVCDDVGNLVSLIDVDTLWFAPIELAVKLPGKVRLEHSSDNSPLRWRPGNQTKAEYPAHYVELVRQAGVDLGVPQIGELYASKTLHYSAVVAMGLYVFDKDDPCKHDNWLRTQRMARLHWLGLGSLESTLPPGDDSAEDVESTVDALLGVVLDVEPEDARAPKQQRYRGLLRFLVSGEGGSMPLEVLAKLPEVVTGVLGDERGRHFKGSPAQQERLSRLVEAYDSRGS